MVQNVFVTGKETDFTYMLQEKLKFKKILHTFEYMIFQEYIGYLSVVLFLMNDI